MHATHNIKFRCNLSDTSVVLSVDLSREQEALLNVLAQRLCQDTDWDFNLVITRNLREDADHDGVHRDVTSRKG